MGEDAHEAWDRVVILPEEMAGVWANLVRVTRSHHEFTIDFARQDFASEEGEAILVARVAMSSLLFTQVMDAVGDGWRSYAEQAFPQEDDDGEAG